MKDTQDASVRLAGSIVIAFVLIVILIFAVNRTDKFLKIKAIDDCAKISRYDKSVEDGTARVWYPITDVYKSCLKDKGY